MNALAGQETGASSVGTAMSIVDANDVATLVREQLTEGVTCGRLWADGRSLAGVMWLEAGAHLAEHTHWGHAHHIWTIDGVVDAVGRRLDAGSYVFVPPGQPHALTAGPQGATVFYLYLEALPNDPAQP